MKLLIAIPALDEEGSIGEVIQQCLAARAHILQTSPVEAVDVTVVSDGSTDGTLPIALRFRPEIHVIAFARNRGYGAAILEAWRQSDADLLGFLDADGTCDPRYFGPFCRTLIDANVDVVLGNRLARGTRMPAVRQLGNWLFGGLLSLLSSVRVQDTASGMRVVRRTALPKLLPLPTGMHFTPAMTARALLRDDLALCEVPMVYAERVGASKLRVFRDGLRFLAAIADATLLYRPSRPFSLLGLLCLAIAGALMLPPLLHYLRTRTVAEWMIYRFVVSHLLGTAGILCLSLAYLSRQIVTVSRLRPRSKSFHFRLLDRVVTGPAFWPLVLGLIVVGAVLVAPSAAELIATGATNEHWSRFLVTSFCLTAAAILLATKVMAYCLRLVEERIEYFERTDAD
jgi:Glycosyl transferase family 2